MDKTLTEQKIQRVLNKFMASPKYKVDGLFVFRWESDKLLWTKSGYIYEFEIKISRADYKNDFKHKAEKHLLLSSKMPKEAESVQLDLFDNLLKQKQKRYPGITKEQLNTYPENTKLPNFFYYAVPEGMLEPDEVPPYAGLIYITTSKGPKYHRDDPDKYYHDIKIVRKAPQLHKTKYTDAELNLGEKFYYNMQTWKHNYREQVNYSLMYRQRLQDELQRKGQEHSYLELTDQLKEAERRVEQAEKNADYYKQRYSDLEHDINFDTIERHMFIDLVKELKPDFNYREFTKQVYERYKERYQKNKEE
jgi:hypothetical protein